MELNYDWRNFQSLFYPGKRATLQPGEDSRTPIYLVTQNDVIVTAFAEYDDLSAWIGQRYQDMAIEMPHREFVLFDREKVDQVLASSLSLPHFYDQVEFMRAEASAQRVAESAKKAAASGENKKPRKIKLKAPKPFVLKPGTKEVAPRHFMLEAMQTWWGKVFPSAFGLFIRLEDAQKGQPSELFLIVRRGRLDGFHVPDLTSLGKDRRKETAVVVRYLSEKHLVPVQGMVVPAAEWNEWAKMVNPWKKVAMSIRADRTKLVPFRWSLTSMMAGRAFFGV